MDRSIVGICVNHHRGTWAHWGEVISMTIMRAFRPLQTRSQTQRGAVLQRDASGLVVLPMSSLTGLCNERRSDIAVLQDNANGHLTTYRVAIPGSLALGAAGECRLASVRRDLATTVAAAHGQHAERLPRWTQALTLVLGSFEARRACSSQARQGTAPCQDAENPCRRGWLQSSLPLKTRQSRVAE